MSTTALHRRLFLPFIVIVALTSGLAVGIVLRGPPPAPEHALTEIGRYEIGGDFELTAPDGSVMGLGDLAGKTLLLFFGYTHCPDVCPMALSKMREVKQRLGADASAFNGVFISLDPERDTPQRLGQYVTYFDPAFIGLTGTPAQIKLVAQRYGVHFSIQPGQPDDDYLVDHSIFGYLLDPGGKVRAIFPGDATTEQMLDGVHQVMEEFAGNG